MSIIMLFAYCVICINLHMNYENSVLLKFRPDINSSIHSIKLATFVNKFEISVTTIFAESAVNLFM